MNDALDLTNEDSRGRDGGPRSPHAENLACLQDHLKARGIEKDPVFGDYQDYIERMERTVPTAPFGRTLNG